MPIPEAVERPGELRINAWDGATSPVLELPARTPFGQRRGGVSASRYLAPAALVDERDWRHPEVGWGLILPDDDGMSDADKAVAADAPEPIRRLVAARFPAAAVLRYRPGLQQNYLRRYYVDGPPEDLSTAAPHSGVERGRTPKYLLIYAAPTSIPWAVQYALNMSSYVGRLDLTEAEGLGNYVAALMGDWAGEQADPLRPLVWTVDHGAPDITWLMSRAIGSELMLAFDRDVDMRARRLSDSAATAEALVAALHESAPGLICTTSHGMTGPVADPALTRSQLGAPVDAEHRPVRLASLADWSPRGAIWYAHACCAAGSDEETRYAELLPETDPAGSLLRGVAAAAGAMVAPLPRALLGAPNPLRAFVGHVEPTFDWTLRDPRNKQVLTHSIVNALYNRLYQPNAPSPIGWALDRVYNEAGSFYGAQQDAVREVDANIPKARDRALYRRLVAMDRQTTVILGDPTVALPLRRN